MNNRLLSCKMLPKNDWLATNATWITWRTTDHRSVSQTFQAIQEKRINMTSRTPIVRGRFL